MKGGEQYVRDNSGSSYGSGNSCQGNRRNTEISAARINGKGGDRMGIEVGGIILD